MLLVCLTVVTEQDKPDKRRHSDVSSESLSDTDVRDLMQDLDEYVSEEDPDFRVRIYSLTIIFHFIKDQAFVFVSSCLLVPGWQCRKLTDLYGHLFSILSNTCHVLYLIFYEE